MMGVLPRSDVKQVIVIRTKYPHKNGGFYKPRTGKLISQAAHASLKVFLDRSILFTPDNSDCTSVMNIPLWEEAVSWLSGPFTKIVVSVESEEELLALKKSVVEAKIPNALIIDSGKTEFNGVPTATVLAIGPYTSSEIDKITGHLPLF